MTRTIIAFGELLWDILPAGRVLGGAPFNFAYRINSLKNRALMISRLGRDELGREAHQQLLDLGMDTEWVQWNDTHPTGTVQVSFAKPDAPDYHILPNVAYDFIQAEEGLGDLVSQVDCVYFGTLAQRHIVSQTALRTLLEMLEATGNATRFLDINFRRNCYCPEVIVESLERADVLKLNDAEAHHLAEILALKSKTLPHIAKEVIGRYDLQCCVITMGASGALVRSPQELVFSPAYQIDLVDTVGAGDAFSAGFIHHYLGGGSLSQSCRYGNAFGALVASQHGATRGVSQAEIEQLIESGATHPIPSEFAHLVRDR